MNAKFIFIILTIATTAGLMGAATITDAQANPWAWGYPKDKCFNGYSFTFNTCHDNDWLPGTNH